MTLFLVKWLFVCSFGEGGRVRAQASDALCPLLLPHLLHLRQSGIDWSHF